MFGGVMSVGTFLAFALSWFEHHSLFWAVVHAIYSWFYVAYYALTKSGAMAPIDATPAMTTGAVFLAVIVGAAVVVAGVFRRPR